MIREKWNEMLRLIAVAFPQWVIKRMTQRTEGKGFAVKAIPFVIVFLSVASIANLSSRAWEHHANFSSYMTGAGIAILVPIAVLAAMLVQGQWAYGFWAMAVLFAAISGTIQYNIYLLPNSGFMGIAEAIAFGYGVPLSEVMLAIMEARLIVQADQRKAEKQAALESAQRQADDIEQRRQQAALERRKRDEIEAENREFERQRKLAELEAYKLKLEQDAEIRREKALASLRIKEQKLVAKSVALQQPTTSATDDMQQNATDLQQLDATSRVNTLYRLLQDGDKGQTHYASLFGVNRSTINRDYAKLTKQGKIYKNGDGGYHVI